MSIKVLSIFSGGGGIDCGFKKAGYDICFSTDFWRPACDTLEKNKVGRLVRCADIRQIHYAEELASIGLTTADIDVLAGGPPCPAYSEASSGKKPWVTCGNAIGDLDYDLPEDQDLQAGSKHKDLLKLVPPGDNYLYFTKERGYPEPIFKWRSRYWSFLLMLSPEKSSWTIQVIFSNNMGPFDGKSFSAHQ